MPDQATCEQSVTDCYAVLPFTDEDRACIEHCLLIEQEPMLRGDLVMLCNGHESGNGKKPQSNSKRTSSRLNADIAEKSPIGVVVKITYHNHGMMESHVSYTVRTHDREIIAESRDLRLIKRSESYPQALNAIYRAFDDGK